jgi:hypothetical protein
VHGRPRAERRFLAAEVECSLSINYIDDFVVGMAVHRCSPWRDHAQELRDVETACVLVHEVSELTVGACLEDGLVGVADRAAPRLGALLLRSRDRDDHELLRPRVLDLVGLAGDHVGAGVGLELVLLAANAKGPPARDDEEELLPLVRATGLRASFGEADDALFQSFRAVAAVDRDLYRSRVDRSTTSWTCSGMSSTRQISWTTPFPSTSTVTRAAMSPYSPYVFIRPSRLVSSPLVSE